MNIFRSVPERRSPERTTLKRSHQESIVLFVVSQDRNIETKQAKQQCAPPVRSDLIPKCFTVHKLWI